MNGGGPPEPHWLYYICVDDIDTAAARVAEAATRCCTVPFRSLAATGWSWARTRRVPSSLSGRQGGRDHRLGMIQGSANDRLDAGDELVPVEVVAHLGRRRAAALPSQVAAPRLNTRREARGRPLPMTAAFRVRRRKSGQT